MDIPLGSEIHSLHQNLLGGMFHLRGPEDVAELLWSKPLLRPNQCASPGFSYPNRAPVCKLLAWSVDVFLSCQRL